MSARLKAQLADLLAGQVAPKDDALRIAPIVTEWIIGPGRPAVLAALSSYAPTDDQSTGGSLVDLPWELRRLADQMAATRDDVKALAEILAVYVPQGAALARLDRIARGVTS